MRNGEQDEVRLRLRHPDSAEDAERIATKLVYGYSHHLYPIDKTEAAKSLGLAVDTMPEDVYRAARAITAACKDEARFVGFSEDVAEASRAAGWRTQAGSGWKCEGEHRRPAAGLWPGEPGLGNSGAGEPEVDLSGQGRVGGP